LAYYIAEGCISCGACEADCPNQAISEGDDIFVIDAEKCTECVGFFDSPQCAEVCPVEAPMKRE
jgi:ferredoxin